jgi:hypothetical protein
VDKGKKEIVCAQHIFSYRAIGVGKGMMAANNQLAVVRFGIKTYKQWQREVKNGFHI